MAEAGPGRSCYQQGLSPLLRGPIPGRRGDGVSGNVPALALHGFAEECKMNKPQVGDCVKLRCGAVTGLDHALLVKEGGLDEPVPVVEVKGDQYVVRLPRNGYRLVIGDGDIESVGAQDAGYSL